MHLLFLFTLSSFYVGMIFMAGAKMPPPAELKDTSVCTHKASFYPYWSLQMKSPDEKSAMCRACMDTDCRFSYCCDYLHHNEESPKFPKIIADPLWSCWLILKELLLFFHSSKSAHRLELNKLGLLSVFFFTAVYHKVENMKFFQYSQKCCCFS